MLRRRRTLRSSAGRRCRPSRSVAKEEPRGNSGALAPETRNEYCKSATLRIAVLLQYLHAFHAAVSMRICSKHTARAAQACKHMSWNGGMYGRLLPRLDRSCSRLLYRFYEYTAVLLYACISKFSYVMQYKSYRYEYPYG